MRRSLARLRDRPIAQGERRTAMAGVLAFLTVATVALTLTQSSGREQLSVGATDGLSGQPVTVHAGPVRLTPPVVEAADRFLKGYLAYVYGHAPLARVRGTTAVFARSLRVERLRVPPGMRALTAHVVALSPVTAPTGMVGVRVLVNDGSLIDYPLVLWLARDGGRLLVTTVGSS